MNVVIHLWTDIADPDSFLGISRIIDAAAGLDVDIEHHALDRPATPSPEAVAIFAEREVTISNASTDEAHALVYAVKATGTTPVDAARAGLEAARRLGEAATTGADISATSVLADIAQSFGVTDWSDPAYREAVRIDREDAARVRATETPFAIIGGLIMASGLKSVEQYRSLIEQANAALSGTAAAAWDEVNARTSGPAH